MSMLKRADVQNIRNELKNEMMRHLPKWRLASKYLAPHRLKEHENKVDGRRRDQYILNNQGGRSLRTFVSGMMNGATPRSRPWFNLISANPARKKSSTVTRYYSETEKVINTHFQLSNLYRVLPLTYKDVGVFSNSAFAMLPHAKHGFYFYPFAIGTYAFASDKDGRTNMFARDFTLNVRQVVETYASLGPDGHIIWDNIPLSVRVDWNAALYLKEVRLSQVVVPNSTYNPKVKSLRPGDKRFQSYTWIEGIAGGGLTNQNPVGFRETNQFSASISGEVGTKQLDTEFLKIGGFDYFPIITPRWEVEPEGYYGIDAPGDIALSDIMTLQDLELYKFEAVQKLVRPAMVGHSSLRRHASSILAGGITYVDDRGMQHGFKPAFTLDPKISELVGSKEEVQSYIKEAFYEDLFRQLSSEKKISHVTAAEINQRTAETMAAMAPVLGQWDFDMSGPLIHNAQIILNEAGRLPERPAELENDELVAEYISVLAQASKASLITTQEKFIAFVAGTAQALNQPVLLQLVNGEQQIRNYAVNSGVDPITYRDESEFKKIQVADAEAQAQAVQTQQTAQGADIAKTMSETQVGNNSALDQAAG